MRSENKLRIINNINNKCTTCNKYTTCSACGLADRQLECMLWGRKWEKWIPEFDWWCWWHCHLWYLHNWLLWTVVWRLQTPQTQFFIILLIVVFVSNYHCHCVFMAAAILWMLCINMIILKRSVNKGKKSNLTLHSWVMINIFCNHIWCCSG